MLVIFNVAFRSCWDDPIYTWMASNSGLWGVMIKTCWKLTFMRSAYCWWKIQIRLVRKCYSFSHSWSDRLVQLHFSMRKIKCTDKEPISNLMCIQCSLLGCIGRKSFLCFVSTFFPNQSHLNSHHIVMMTSELVNRNFPWGLEGSIIPVWCLNIH